jgi:hypothetical protein
MGRTGSPISPGSFASRTRARESRGGSPADVPLFLARAGRDEIPHLNDALDRFLAHAVARNLPVSFVNHPEGPHAFDLVHDSEMSREVVRWAVAFLSFHLS